MPPLRRSIFFAWAVLVCAPATSWAEARPFFRVVDDVRPSPAAVKRDQLRYGAQVLYTGDVQGKKPQRVSGTVWHQSLEDARYFIGTKNPAIRNPSLLRRIAEDKWREAKLLQRYVPDAIPETQNVSSIVKALALPRRMPREERLAAIEAELRVRFPRGFFLKHVSSFNSDGTFPTDKNDFKELYQSYKRNVRPALRRMVSDRADEVEIHLALRDRKHYAGRVLETILTNPDKIIVQEKIDAARTMHDGKAYLDEYRVHTVDGKVLIGATAHRWLDSLARSPSSLHGVNDFAQSVLDRLPADVKAMSFGMDVMRTKDGGYRVIELNPGGQSGYLCPEDELWDPQLLAQRFTGEPTALQKKMTDFRRAPTLRDKAKRFDEILEMPELRKMVHDKAPISEMVSLGKDHLLRAYPNPNRKEARALRSVMRRLHMTDYLTDAEAQRLRAAAGGG